MVLRNPGPTHLRPRLPPECASLRRRRNHSFLYGKGLRPSLRQLTILYYPEGRHHFAIDHINLVDVNSRRRRKSLQLAPSFWSAGCGESSSLPDEAIVRQ